MPACQWFAVAEGLVYFAGEVGCKKWAAAKNGIVKVIPAKFSDEATKDLIAKRTAALDYLDGVMETAISENRSSAALATMRKMNAIKARIWESEGMLEVAMLRRVFPDVKTVEAVRPYACFIESRRARRRNSDFSYVEELVFHTIKKGLRCPFCGRETNNELA